MRSFECGKSLFPIRKKKIIALTFKTSIIIPHQALNSCNVHLHINLLKVLTVRWSRNIKKKLTSKQSTRGSYIKIFFKQIRYYLSNVVRALNCNLKTKYLWIHHQYIQPLVMFPSCVGHDIIFIITIDWLGT